MSVVQSILFNRHYCTLKEAEDWLKDNNYRYNVSIECEIFKFKQYEPNLLNIVGYHNITIKKINNYITFIIYH
jgi:hypothetical protein